MGGTFPRWGVCVAALAANPFQDRRKDFLPSRCRFEEGCKSQVTGIAKWQPSRASHSPPSRLTPYKVQTWFAFLPLQSIKALSVFRIRAFYFQQTFDISVAAFAGRIKASNIYVYSAWLHAQVVRFPSIRWTDSFSSSSLFSLTDSFSSSSFFNSGGEVKFYHVPPTAKTEILLLVKWLNCEKNKLASSKLR